MSGGETRWFDTTHARASQRITERTGPIAFADGRVVLADFDAGVFVYERIDGEWVETLVTTGVVGPVALHGDDPVVLGQSGALYVFTADGLGNFDPSRIGAGFRSVAAGPDQIIAGRRAATIQNPAGVVTVFTADGQGDFEITALLPSDSRPGDGFGATVAVDGSNFVIGSTSAKAYVFSQDPLRGRIEHRLPVPRSAFDGADSAFGLSVGAMNGRVIIGSPNGPNAGTSGLAAAYEYAENALGNWVNIDTFTGPSPGGSFGAAVGVAGETVIVGAPDAANGTGRVWAYAPIEERATSEVGHAVSCLAGRGRVDVNIVNVGAADAVYRVRFEGLAPRTRIVAEGDWWRSPVTGRTDGDYRIVVEREGTTIDDTTVTVDCTGATQVTEGPIQVMSACVNDRGYVLFQFVNPTAQAQGYVIQFAGVPNRSTSAEPSGAAVRATSGRGDGIYGVRVLSGAETIDVFAVRVDCSPEPE